MLLPRPVFQRTGMIVCVIALVGCAEKKQPTLTEVPQQQQTWNTKPMVAPIQPPRAVATGSLPLVYMVETPQMVRVTDLTTNENIFQVPVPARTIVSVSERGGVQLGGATMKLGPLNAEHRYAIYLESSTRDSSVTQGQIRPGDPNPPPAAPVAPAPEQPTPPTDAAPANIGAP